MKTYRSPHAFFLLFFVLGACFVAAPRHVYAALYNASGLLGQTTYTQALATSTAQGLDFPVGTALDSVNHRLFVADVLNNRVLIYNLDTENNIATTTASYVLGQTNFTSNTATTIQDGLYWPIMPQYDPINQRLFVLEFKNSRVLVFNVAPST